MKAVKSLTIIATLALIAACSSEKKKSTRVIDTEAEEIIDESASTDELSENATTIKNGNVAGHDWVDLSLPSGTLWATCNLGATTPTEVGNLYRWGETVPMDENVRYKFKGDSFSMTKYNVDPNLGYDQQVPAVSLEDVDDAAYVNWGEEWCMPTEAQLEELYNRASIKETTIDGVKGLTINAWGSSTESIFIPFDQEPIDDTPNHIYLWSRELSLSEEDAVAIRLSANDMWCGSFSNQVRWGGHIIRPVLKKNAKQMAEEMEGNASQNKE